MADSVVIVSAARTPMGSFQGDFSTLAAHDLGGAAIRAAVERAYLVAYKPDMSEEDRRRWNSWDDYMREWCRREDFANALPLLLRGEDPEFQEYLRRVAEQERGSPFSQPSIVTGVKHG